ncbi:MAG TPA: urate oxidase [Pyrinomonadaceae bacterium]|nr:urate oxidase [Pyrinomonadaceae bacterium]
MPVKIVHNNYGKARVRLLKVARDGERHELQNLTVRIAFEGDFADVHTTGDNAKVLPTDTMKNTVYTLSQQVREIEEIETFALRLANYFLANNTQVSRAVVEIAEHGWTRINVGGAPHEHSFIKSGDEKRTTTADVTREAASVESGIEDLIVLKTTKSGFAGFIKDCYTTLPEATDRIFCTSVTAGWRYKNVEAATGDAWRDVRQTIIETFADHDSLSVQHTLYAMGEAVLEKFAFVAEIAFSLPNIHCLPFDFTRFGLENDNRIFTPTDEPHGLIEARLSR